ncbi:MAG: DUF6259 domain-containing protein [Armatimonadia bacterium]
MTRMLTILALLGSCAALCAQEAFRDDFDTVTAWEAKPEWLANDSPTASVTTQGGIARFAIAEPGKGMKWMRQLEDPLDLDLTPWLVIRYRATNFNPPADYLFWLNDAKPKDGVPFKAGERLPVDGQWHTVALDLWELKVLSPVTQLGVQCQATAAGQAAVEVDYIAFMETPPADAEGLQQPTGPAQEWPVTMREAAQWTLQPTWLSNHSESASLAAAPDGEGLIFRMPDGGCGAKWSRELATPVEGARWASLRYRARSLRTYGDYVIYIASSGGGKATEEQYVIQQGDLISDGEWHVALGRVTVPKIQTVAVQVQAGRAEASLQIAELKFLDRKPVMKLADTFDGVAGWPKDMKSWRVVSLPPANLSGTDLSRRLGAEGWIAEGQVTASGVPFEVRKVDQALNMTPLKEPGEVAVPLVGKAAEAYLLMAAQFPTRDEASYKESGLIRQVHRLVVRVEYADGSVDEQFPLSVNSGEHAVSRWLHTYAVALEPQKTLKRLVLVDTMDRGAFGLAALTLSDKPGPASRATAAVAQALPRGDQPIESRAAGIRRVGDQLQVDAWSVSMTLDCSKGLRVSNLSNHSAIRLKTGFAPGPLFRVIGEGFEVTSEQFAVKSIADDQDGKRIELTCEAVKPAITVTVWVEVRDPREIGLRAEIGLNGQDPAKTRFIFPELKDLSFGGKEPDQWIWCPRRGDVITNQMLSLRENYGGAGNPLQIIGCFDASSRTGLYVMTQDQDAISRFYQVQKAQTGARLAVEYNPLHNKLLPRTVIGCLQGDWHEQLAHYREWADTWYKPAAPRKRWFREVFNFRQQFLSFDVPTKSGMFDKDTKTLRLKEVVDADAKAFGGVDYLHLFDWGWDPVHGRCGDYAPWDYLGGVDNFKQAVAEVQASGVPVGLYLEGVLVDPQSNLGKAHGAAWQMLDPQGKPYTYYAPSYHMCSNVPEWQEALSDTYRRVARETGAKGFYIDEYGFAHVGHWCYNPAHGHPVPMPSSPGQLLMTKKLREKLGPEAVIYTEESPIDVTSQYQDGSFTYNISSVSDAWSPSHVNLYRFAFPDFKTIEIITCDKPLGTNVEAAKLILFNGEAIWLEGNADKWFSPSLREQIALNRRVMRENRQCFAGNYPTPLVPTLRRGIYANQFSERPDLLGKTCWTVYNTNYRTARGELLAVDHQPGCQYLDEMTGKPLKARIAGGMAYLTLEVAPRDVVVISRGLYVK